MASELVLFRVVDTGETVQVTDGAPAKTHMKLDDVLIIINDAQRKIWIWKGNEAPVRRKFIAARSASGIRDQRGLTYKIISEDQGQEDNDFLAAMGQSPTTKVDEAGIKSAEGPSAPPLPPPTPSEAEPRRIPPSAEGVQPDYTKVVVTATRVPEKQPVQVPRPPSEIIKQVEQLEPVPGHRREFVLIGFDAFGITEESSSILGKKTIKRRLQRIDSLPEGTIFAQGYTPRVVVKNGQVLAIEFLKQLEEEEYLHEKPDVKAAMKRHLIELIQTTKPENTKEDQQKTK